MAVWFRFPDVTEAGRHKTVKMRPSPRTEKPVCLKSVIVRNRQHTGDLGSLDRRRLYKMAAGQTLDDWQRTFNQLKRTTFPDSDTWRLEFKHNLPERLTNNGTIIGWRVYHRRAHGRFRCSSCPNQWTSDRAVVLFAYRHERFRNQGKVMIRLFGQRCLNCRMNYEQLELSMRTVLRDLVLEIRRKCYHERNAPAPQGHGSDNIERVMTGPHREELCEACGYRKNIIH
nr:receptor-transporting protein 4-like isoform X1 [Paramormyrops kingsleyae]